MTSLEPEAALALSLQVGVQVKVTVQEARTQCCGGGWRHWDGTRGPLVRAGRVVKMENGVLLLHSGQLGRITQLLAELVDVLDAQIV